MAIITGPLGMREDRFTFTANTDEPVPAAEFDIVIEKPREMRSRPCRSMLSGSAGRTPRWS